MKWLFVEIQGDSVIFRCSVCNSEISVKQGEELPYCKHCENEPDGELFNEVVKVLESCIDSKVGCSKCPYLGTEIKENITCGLKMLKNALDLINRQKAENKELISKLDELKSEYALYKISAQERIESLISGQETLQKFIAKKDVEIDMLNQNIEVLAICKKDLPQITMNAIKSEAVKELIEKLTEEYAHYNLASTISIDVIFCDIKRIAKEMVGE